MNRIIHYALGLVVVAGIIGFFFARDRLLGLVFGKLPDWASMTLVFGLILIVVVLGVWQQLKAKPPPSRFCIECGYDLRATPDRCPECGTIPSEKRTTG